jgi:cytohesin
MNPNSRYYMGWTDLHDAASAGDAERVRELLEKGVDPNVRDQYGNTPLHWAASKGHVDVVELLLEHGADPNAKNERGWTPLHVAAFWGHVDVVKLFLERGVDPNIKDKNGLTPLHIAAIRGYVDVARLLLQYGVDPNVQDERGRTPLHVAAIRGRVDVVRFLLEHGANPNARDKDGMTPLHLMSEYYEFLSLLISYGDMDEVLKYGNTPPPRWVPCHVEVAKLLLEHGADPNAKNKGGWTPLHVAAYEGRVDIVALLLEHGVDPNVQDKFGLTPLHVAAYEGRVDVVRLLLEHGADPTVKNKDGDTPLDLARARGHREVVSLIEEFHMEGWLRRGGGPPRPGAAPVRSASDAVCKAVCEAWRIISQVYDFVKEARAMTAKEREDLEGLFHVFKGHVEALERMTARPDAVEELRSFRDYVELLLPQLKQGGLDAVAKTKITSMRDRFNKLREELACSC